MFKRLFYILKQRLYVSFKRKNINQGKVYMFHNICDESDTYNISKDNFKKFLDYLVSNYKIVDVKTLIKEKNARNIVLTFDDAYKSVYENVYELLKEYDVPYYIFICNEYLNKDKYLNEEEIKKMLKYSKCILGSHSYFHELSRFIKLEDFKKHIELSKQELQDRFDVDVIDFAFPYGSIYAVSNDNIYEAKKLFEHVYLTYNLAYNEEYENEIPRININNDNFQKEMR